MLVVEKLPGREHARGHRGRRGGARRARARPRPACSIDTTVFRPAELHRRRRSSDLSARSVGAACSCWSLAAALLAWRAALIALVAVPSSSVTAAVVVLDCVRRRRSTCSSSPGWPSAWRSSSTTPSSTPERSLAGRAARAGATPARRRRATRRRSIVRRRAGVRRPLSTPRWSSRSPWCRSLFLDGLPGRFFRRWPSPTWSALASPRCWWRCTVTPALGARCSRPPLRAGGRPGRCAACSARYDRRPRAGRPRAAAGARRRRSSSRSAGAGRAAAAGTSLMPAVQGARPAGQLDGAAGHVAAAR